MAVKYWLEKEIHTLNLISFRSFGSFKEVQINLYCKTTQQLTNKRYV